MSVSIVRPAFDISFQMYPAASASPAVPALRPASCPEQRYSTWLLSPARTLKSCAAADTAARTNTDIVKSLRFKTASQKKIVPAPHEEGVGTMDSRILLLVERSLDNNRLEELATAVDEDLAVSLIERNLDITHTDGLLD